MNLPLHRVLCVEDDADFCEIISFVLTPDGYEVVLAHTLAEAQAKATEAKVDLYLIDQRLPDGEGIELCRTLRARNPRVPILICTGDARDAVREAALAAGATHFVTKPVDPIFLAKLVRDSIAAAVTPRDEA